MFELVELEKGTVRLAMKAASYKHYQLEKFFIGLEQKCPLICAIKMGNMVACLEAV